MLRKDVQKFGIDRVSKAYPNLAPRFFLKF